MEMEEIARWSFIAFVVIAVLMGLAVGYMAWDGQDVSTTDGYVLLIMLILGIVVGIAGSVTTKEITPFLIATIALIVASSTNVWSPLQNVHELLSSWATYILAYIVAFAAPAAVIIAIKQVFAMAKEK
jgi:DMSO reductase anchor subunit